MLTVFILSFLNCIKSVKRYSEHTIRNYSIDFDDLLGFLAEKEGVQIRDISLYKLSKLDIPLNIEFSHDLNITSLNRTNIRAFMAYMYQNNKSRRTIIRRVASLKSFCKFLLSENIITHDPAENIGNISRPALNSHVLDREFIYNFFNQPNLSTFKGFRDRVIMELLYCTGLRVSEASSINIEDICFENMSIKIRGKGKQERISFFNDCVSEWLKAYINHPKRKETVNCGLIDSVKSVFLNCFGDRLNVRSIHRMFKFYIAKSGLVCRITPHSLRRALACHFLERGVDIKKIKKILGHKSLSSTIIYAQSTSKTRIDEYNRAHPRA